jgi:hypothetical protein
MFAFALAKRARSLNVMGMRDVKYNYKLPLELAHSFSLYGIMSTVISIAYLSYEFMPNTLLP